MSYEIIPVSSIPTAITTANNPADLERIRNTLLKNVAASSARVYEQAAREFTTWLSAKGLTVQTVTYEDLSEYRSYLAEHNAKATAARKLVVARRLLDVAVILKVRTDNPAKQVKGFKNSNQETTHRALTSDEARLLLNQINLETPKGTRDYALILLLLRTGLRRAEAAGLTIGDIKTEQGYNIAVVRHGKGDKRRIVKLHDDVVVAIKIYLETTKRHKLYDDDAPLFVAIRASGKCGTDHLKGLDIERIVEGYAAKAELIGLTPHGLRASFVTLALEGGASLHQVQYAAGHADPRTTERYQKRKLNLADNATDYLKL